jgi:hypothetical protein
MGIVIETNYEAGSNHSFGDVSSFLGYGSLGKPDL